MVSANISRIKDTVSVKPFGVGTDMIDRDIEHQVHVSGMHLICQFGERFIASEIRIDEIVIERIIAMHRRCPEDRIQIDGIDAEILQIVEFFNNTVQIAAVEIETERRLIHRRRFIPILDLLDEMAAVRVFAVGDMEIRATVSKPIGKDLVLSLIHI